MHKPMSAALLLLAACAPKETPKPAEQAAAPVVESKPVFLGACVDAVLAAKPGKIVKLEGKTENGVVVYEFDVQQADGKAWDLECDAAAAKVTEVEEEVKNAKAAGFAEKVKVTEADARKTALAAHPGEVTEVEYEIEANGDASYEFDIKGTDGKETKVEVDATSGKIVEEHAETFQIGEG